MKCRTSSTTGWAVLHALLRMRESILLTEYEMVSSHVVNLKIGEWLGTFLTPCDSAQKRTCCHQRRRLQREKRMKTPLSWWISNSLLTSDELTRGLNDRGRLRPAHIPGPNARFRPKEYLEDVIGVVSSLKLSRGHHPRPIAWERLPRTIAMDRVLFDIKVFGPWECRLKQNPCISIARLPQLGWQVMSNQMPNAVT
jgi:hypothetical protein